MAALEKHILRKEYLEKRLNLPANELSKRNEAILKHFCRIDFREVRYLHSYLPIREKNEVDTMLLIDWLKENLPEIRIVVPKSDFNTNIMSHYALGEIELRVGRFGIPEPVSGEEVAIKSIDMAIVPLLAVDKRGHRVGYGRGFYDRFLIECRPDVQTIGVSFFDPLEEIADTGLQDVPLKKCITPSGIIEFA
ncbi:5-formyltetrahydrofolate cyclo-ligase [Anseongella ginsenosidimutans]|uniref:5-formyltetrahydrofolate cyclo-ligase n=1 Tax=Anseongella ginsenosidimutans TaxID=496056 RepID=A0A4R3KXB3_9SPHI|nr:5-formyltetrahydrofolate cyclo-ligase [Anseongella ginsenosidimutans]QEC51421.1 5-formyltetrahydrofolate cyclo-ligase [Anseongella ginsenosidimutans]TCS89874.1 5-formyltetrahydrofolate cyclo-ligase [Anseongella ginsenosidimutans]